MAAVYGPRQAQQKNEDAEKAVIEVVFKPRSGFQEYKDRDFEGTIRRTLEGVIPLGMHPRTSIMIVLQVLQDDGALLSCSLNAACAALIDAGIPMNMQLASITCALLADGSIFVDPTSKEEEAATALVSVTFPFHFDMAAAAQGGKAQAVVEESVLASHTWGSFSMDQYLDMLGICLKGSAQVAEFSRIFLRQGLVV